MYKEKAKKNEKTLTFKPGDLVWLQLRKERSSSARWNKLKSRGDMLLKILGKVHDSACKLGLLRDIGVSSTFIVGNLALYF